jgi:hypothetical protein
MPGVAEQLLLLLLLGRVQGLRGTPAISLPHVLLLLRRLPGLVSAAELGFRAQLRHQQFVRELVEEAIR